MSTTPLPSIWMILPATQPGVSAIAWHAAETLTQRGSPVGPTPDLISQADGCPSSSGRRLCRAPNIHQRGATDLDSHLKPESGTGKVGRKLHPRVALYQPHPDRGHDRGGLGWSTRAWQGLTLPTTPARAPWLSCHLRPNLTLSLPKSYSQPSSRSDHATEQACEDDDGRPRSQVTSSTRLRQSDRPAGSSPAVDPPRLRVELRLLGQLFVPGS